MKLEFGLFIGVFRVYCMNMKDLEIHKKFEMYGRNAREWMRKCVLLLPEIEKRKIWRKKGFGSIYEYAAKLAGMSRDKVNEGLRILKLIEDKPELMDVAREKGVLAVRPVATIATSDDASFWAEKAREMSIHTLETFVRDTHRHVAVLQPEKITISMDLSREIATKLEKLKGDGEWENLMRKFLILYECEIAIKKPVPVESKSRYIPAKIRKYVISKTNGRCGFPKCARPYAVLHHTWRYEFHGVHDPDAIVPLCKAHHDLAHLGLIENEESAPEIWEIRSNAEADDPKYYTDKIVARFKARFP